MKYLSAIALSAFLFSISSNAHPEDDILIPISDHRWPGWEHRLSKRSGKSALALQNEEHLVWGSKNGGGVFANMTLGTGEEQLVISMDRFKDHLTAVDCSDEMFLTFTSNATYQDAIDDWEWVNFNEKRTFILIADYKGCGEEFSRDPWVVQKVRYDDPKLTVHLSAVRKDWKELGTGFELDFGKFAPEETAPEEAPKKDGKDRRFLDFITDPIEEVIEKVPDVVQEVTEKVPEVIQDVKDAIPDISSTKSFTVPLSKQFPAQILKPITKGSASVGIDCTDCNFSGSLEFEGHIKYAIDKFSELSIKAIPKGIAANLGLTLSATGSVARKTGAIFEHPFEIVKFGVPGLTIPKVLTIGPNVAFNGGFAIPEISGSAVISTGVTMSIPDDSHAAADFVSQKKISSNGWVPDVKTKPLEMNGAITASVEIWTEIAVALTLEVFGSGFNLDLALEVPKVIITAEMKKSNTEPACPGSKKNTGVSIDVEAGGNLALKCYLDIGAKRKDFLDEPLFTKTDVFKAPHVCLPFGDDIKAISSSEEAAPSTEIQPEPTNSEALAATETGTDAAPSETSEAATAEPTADGGEEQASTESEAAVSKTNASPSPTASKTNAPPTSTSSKANSADPSSALLAIATAMPSGIEGATAPTPPSVRKRNLAV